ncbi:hypothetical protein BT69DRAFT_379932 [Atractiella rhizophila]|nr:hypothetical protein BT69DRAFT_379932 [Atractiella rhizophila]
MTTSILPLHVPLPPRPTRRAFFSLLLLVVTVLLLSYSRPSTLSSLPSFGLSSAPVLMGPGYLSLIRASKTTKVPTVLLIGDRTQTFASGRPNDRTHLLSAEARMHYHKHASSSLPPEDETNSFLALDINTRGFSRKEQVPNIYLVPSDPGPHFTIKSESARPPTAWGYGINPVEEPREYDPST